MKNRFGSMSPIFWIVLGFLAGLLLLAIILSSLSQSWREDFWPEFLASLAVAAAAFLVVDLLFGLTKRKEQEDRARKQAQVFLDLEIAQNLNLIEHGLKSWLNGHPESIDLKQDGWMDLMKSALFPMLSQELVSALSVAYINLSELRVRLYHWQQKGPKVKELPLSDTELTTWLKWREASEEATIRWAKKTLKSLDTALKILHE